MSNFVEDIAADDEEEQVMINVRLPLQVKIDCDNLYIERIKQNPKLKVTRAVVLREIIEAGVKKLMEDIV